MSFMSFDYAMRASEATLSFHQNQGQNIKDTNSRVREVGTGNAKRKDDLVRQKIEAEYAAKSADVKKDKAEQLMKVAEKRKQNATMAAGLVGIGTFLGGMIDGAMDMKNADKDQMPENDQVTMDASQIDVGKNVAAFRIAQGNGNSEQGAVVAYDSSKGNFSVVGVNTTTGQVNGFVNLSQTDMARNIMETIGDNPATDGSEREAGGRNDALLGFMEQGPPPMFTKDAFVKDEAGNPTSEFTAEAQAALFGDNGFFSQGSNAGGPLTGSDAGEQMVAGLLHNPAPVTSAYRASAEGIIGLLDNKEVQKGLQLPEDKDLGKLTKSIFKDQGVLDSGPSALQKLLFKPLGTSLNQFMEMAKVAREYEEEYNAKVAEYEAAKKQAGVAYEKLQKLESMLASGGTSS